MLPTHPPNDFTILLVDDREENLLALEDMLATDNRIFIKATSGSDALRKVLKNESIGLIMLDVQMPEMDGFEVAQLLKSNPRTKDIAIIFVTAISKDEQYVLKGFGEGAVDYLQKPLDINVTKAKVNVFERLYRYQQELKQSVQQIERINKQLEKFVYVVAHDLKSPLTGIIGAMSLLEMASENPAGIQDELLDYISHSKQASYYMANMINSLLDYSRKSIDQQTIEDVDVQELVEQIAKLLFPPKHITIQIHGPLPLMRTKKLKLQQVLQNLISNAIKYNDKPQGLIEIGYTDFTKHIEFYVRDNGAGIAVDEQDVIFNLFQKTANTTTVESSTGVGLSILKLLVEEQGGRVWVNSTPGQGSTFYFDWSK
ncbi:response regulator [Spirosoma sp. KCTC 42546]|uniref:sensor histidine kinase n=1 Tax=Spirosoma sp. KCTC 42546 TaxID=2520506 RepID=UPI00115BAE1B|nr:hybrid sensor histidine kinase/response regulator [Spirosoma sp. KCTC 42546]QDK79741.1 response regulator [Spirosoma sp. KCTC 42546]